MITYVRTSQDGVGAAELRAVLCRCDGVELRRPRQIQHIFLLALLIDLATEEGVFRARGVVPRPVLIFH